MKRTNIKVPLATLVTASRPPGPNASPNPKNPTLYNGVKRFFVVHGGLFSREDVLLSEIKAIDRIKQRQPGQEGLMCEMLWTDPQDMHGRGPSKRVGQSSPLWSLGRQRNLMNMCKNTGSRNRFRTRRYKTMDHKKFRNGRHPFSRSPTRRLLSRT
jgi:hypothetical protein